MDLLWLLLAVPLGLLVGTLTGLFPGIHVNVVASLMVGLAATLHGLGVPVLAIVLFIVAVAVTHSFFDIIPTLFLGVPADESYALLPTQRLVREGRGIEAMRLAVHGSWWALLFTAALVGAFALTRMGGYDLIGSAETIVKPWLFWIMACVSVVLVLTDKQKVWAAVIFLVAGLFGVVIFATPLIPGGTDAAFNGLFPALSGLFGVSGLVLSLRDATGPLPWQNPHPPSDIGEGHYLGATASGTLGGMVVGLLPGLGAANVATLMSLISQRQGDTERAERQYIVTTSAINVSDTVFGIASLYFIGKARSGASVAIGKLVGTLGLKHLVAIAVVMVIVGWLARRVILSAGFGIARAVNRLDFRGLSLAVIGLIAVLVWQITGLWGLVILIGTSLLGMVAPIVCARRAQAMGLFLMPVMLYYSGHQAAVVTWLQLESIVLPAPQTTLAQVMTALGLGLAVAVVLYIAGAVTAPPAERHSSIR